MKYVLTIFGLIIINISASQEIIEIEIDSLHCQDSKCFMINISEEDIYECEFTTLTMGEFKYKQVIDCWPSENLELNSLRSNTLVLYKISDINEFYEWTSKLNLSSTFKYQNKSIKKHFQSIDKNYGIMQEDEFDPQTSLSKIKRKDVYKIIPIKVNQEFFIAGLIDMDYGEIEHVFFPHRNKRHIMNANDVVYNPTIDTIEVDKYTKRQLFNSYKLRVKNSKVSLTNTISSYPLIKGQFDTILLEFPFVITKSDGTINIYDVLLNDITPSNIQAAYNHFGSLQIIHENKVRYLASDGSISDTLPKIERVLDCGNVACMDKRIVKIGVHFMEVITDCNSPFYGYQSKFDTFQFKIEREITDIRYLNNTTSKIFSVDCFKQFYCQQTDLYYFRTKENVEGIFKRTNEKEVALYNVLNNQNIPRNEKRQQYLQLRDSLPTTFKDEVIFEGYFSEIHLLGYNHPILFKEKHLYAIYPQMIKGRYKLIKNFIGNLAEVTFENGDLGWIDLEGNEIFGRKKDDNNEK